MPIRKYAAEGGFGWAEPELQVEDKDAGPGLVESVTRPLSVEMLKDVAKQVRAAAGKRPSAASVQLARGSALELGVSAALRATINDGLRAAWGSLLRTGLQPHALSTGPQWFLPSMLRLTGAR
jgi:hypothetical protein